MSHVDSSTQDADRETSLELLKRAVAASALGNVVRAYRQSARPARSGFLRSEAVPKRPAGTRRRESGSMVRELTVPEVRAARPAACPLPAQRRS